MAGENATPPRRVLLDTNIFIIAFSEPTSTERDVLGYLTDHRAEVALLLSDEMQDQLLRVAKRVKGKDWAGLLLS
jgi:predicted nucleic acid-binding protein